MPSRGCWTPWAGLTSSTTKRRVLNCLVVVSTTCSTWWSSVWRRGHLGPICEYAQHVAEERFDAGFGIAEVQSAFNVLEEAIWHVVLAQLPADDLLEAAGLVGTILGAGRDALARTWVSLATSQHVPSLDLTALFEGAAT